MDEESLGQPRWPTWARTHWVSQEALPLKEGDGDEARGPVDLETAAPLGTTA